VNAVPNNGEHCVVVSNASPGGEVDLYYRNWVNWSTGNIGQGPGAVAWLIGDVNGSGEAEVVQPWDNGGKLGMIVYGWSGSAMTTLWGTSNIGEGSGAVAWLIGDVNGSGKDEVIQLWNNGGQLGVIVYGWSGSAMTTLWGTGNIGQGSGAVAWLIGDVNGDGKDEVIQLWNNGGKLGMIVYGWSGSAMTTLWGTSNIGEGSGAVAWQIGDVNGDGKDEVIQLWNNGGKLGMIVYGWCGSGMTTLCSSSNVGEGPGAVAWLTGPVQGGVVDEIVQLWDNGGRLGVILYSAG
jgi:hypothetical protein